MTRRLLFDTDVLVDYLRGIPEAVGYVEQRTETLLLSAISVAELFAGVREGRERVALHTFVAAFEIVPIDREIGERGGLLRREFRATHALSLADALIAATADVADAELVTLNLKHFPMFAGLRPPYRKSPHG